jgi:hypothetical protein
MKIMRRAADFWGRKEKRGKNEERISMGKKANAFFFLSSFFLTLLLLSSRFSQKKTGARRRLFLLPGRDWHL